MKKWYAFIILIYSGLANAVDLGVSRSLSERLIYQCKIETSNYRGADAYSVFQTCFTLKGYSYNGLSVSRLPTKEEQRILDIETESQRAADAAAAKNDPNSKLPRTLRVITQGNVKYLNNIRITDANGKLLSGLDSIIADTAKEAKQFGVPNPFDSIPKDPNVRYGVGSL